MIYGVQLFQSIILWLMLALTSLAEWLLGQMGVTNPVAVRLLHGVAMALVSWSIVNAIYGERSTARNAGKRLHRPILWRFVLGTMLLLFVFFNAFEFTSHLTNWAGSALPFTPSEEAAGVTFRIGERIVSGLLSFLGVMLLKSSIYGKPPAPKEEKRRRKRTEDEGDENVSASKPRAPKSSAGARAARAGAKAAPVERGEPLRRRL